MSSLIVFFLVFLLLLRYFAKLLSITKDRKFGFTLEMRTFQFQMPFFLIDTCLTLRFTFSEVNTKTGPNSVPELSVNLIEALSTDKLRLIVSS